MKGHLVVVVAFLRLFTGISGRVILTDEQCTQPLWTVVGNHYVPGKTCPVTNLDIAKESALRQKYFEKLSAGQTNPDVEEINKILDRLVMLLPNHSYKSQKDELICNACSIGIDIYKLLKTVGVRKKIILGILDCICVDFNIMSPKICSGALNLYGNTLANLIDETWRDSQLICSLILNLKCGNKNFLELQWNVTLPRTRKPPILRPVPPHPNAPKLKVLHISDTHWDTQYKVGTWAECNLPLCCREDNILPNDKATVAGKYGGWKCDPPEETFNSVLAHIAKHHPDLDYIIWTGDIPAHDLWEQTIDSNLDILKKTVAKLSKFFPKTPVYPALGNHESVPANMFPTGEVRAENPMDWLFDELNNQWLRWLPKNVSNSVRLGAFYTTLIRPGFRLISMNMNYCYKMNWYLIKNNIDPMDELKWLVKLLQKAENLKEKVHIIGHIPPGHNDCIKSWQTNYYKIINRYESTVTAQFFGHTHADEFEVFYDMKHKNRPFGVAYIAPSVTTYTYHNPSYRIYYVEGDYKGSQRYVLDHESWYMDLEKSNKENSAEWKKLYSAKEAYKMKSLYPQDWHYVYLKIKSSDSVLQQYHNYYWNNSPRRPFCDKSCRYNHLCDIRCCDQYGPPDN